MNKRMLAARLTRILIFTSLMVILLNPGRVFADDGPGRKEIIEISYIEYNWRLMSLDDNDLVCELKIDHPDQPTGPEIYYQCGEKIYYQWLGTATCAELAEGDTQDCSGIYLFPLRSEEITKEIVLDLPSPTVRIDLAECVPVQGTDLCENKPILLISAEEPLPNEEIILIQGRIDDKPFSCADETCKVPLQETDKGGIGLEFWADSSYGDSTDHFMGRIRVLKISSEDLKTSGWQVEIVSGLDDLDNMNGCAGIWSSFPPLGNVPDWLDNPSSASMLKTNEPYTYLAGQMILEGYIDTSRCDDRGLTAEGYASQCGLEASRGYVNLWQNTFDSYIYKSAEETGIPAYLLKRIFARESQFWPETTQDLYREYGFGHMTELGADTTLLWNRDFYDQFCPLVLEVGRCQLGYAKLDDWSQATLRGALLIEMEIFLPEYAFGIDLEQVEESVSLFSETLLGNCAQVGQMITYKTDRIPGEIVTYDDLWRFTLVNYQGGSGCLAEAIIDVHKQKQPLIWENISATVAENCPWTIPYVNDITR